MELIIKIIGAVAAVFVIALLVSFPVMWLWNWLMPEIFGLIEIDFWQALGLALLCNALFNNTGSKSN